MSCCAPRCALPQQPPRLHRAQHRRAAPPRCSRGLASRRRAPLRCRPPRAAPEEASAPSAPPPPPPSPAAAPAPRLWAVPWDEGVSATVCARFAFLWLCVGFAGPSLLQQLAGAPLAADARAEATLALELLKATLVYHLARPSLSLSFFAARNTPLTPRLLCFASSALVAAGAVRSAASALVRVPRRGGRAGAGRGGRGGRRRRSARRLRRRARRRRAAIAGGRGRGRRLLRRAPSAEVRLY